MWVAGKPNFSERCCWRGYECLAKTKKNARKIKTQAEKSNASALQRPEKKKRSGKGIRGRKTGKKQRGDGFHC